MLAGNPVRTLMRGQMGSCPALANGAHGIPRDSSNVLPHVQTWLPVPKWPAGLSAVLDSGLYESFLLTDNLLYVDCR